MTMKNKKFAMIAIAMAAIMTFSMTSVAFGTGLYSFDVWCLPITEFGYQGMDALYFVCSDIEPRIEALENEIISLQNDITALTLLHYPIPVEPPLVGPTPTPVQPPVIGVPEFAPDKPTISTTFAENGNSIKVQYKHPFVQTNEPRGAVPPEFVIETSQDGINWTSENIGTSLSNRVLSAPVNTETLVRMYAINEFGVSEYTVTHSAIPLDPYGYLESGRILTLKIAPDNTSIDIRWESPPVLFGYDLVSSEIQKSVNYGNFTTLADVGSDRYGWYNDADVTSGDIYSYRIITTTTNEVHPRSGFNSFYFDATVTP